MENEVIDCVVNTANKISLSFGSLIEQGMSLVPYLGSMYGTIKFNRLQRRLEENSEKLKKISLHSSFTNLSKEYISERIFPLVLGDLIEEHEDAKIILILNGFENVFIEENNQESIVLSYFDTLRGLRYADIKRLFYLAGEIESFPIPINDSEEHALIRNIDAKLKNLALIGEKSGFSFGSIEAEEDTNKENIFVNLYCRKFIDFITVK